MPEADTPDTTAAADSNSPMPSPHRRIFLGHLAGLGTAAAIVHTGTPGARAASPDAELLALVAEFLTLQHRIEAGYDLIEDDDERDTAMAPWCDRQKALLDLTVVLWATTRAGFMARARMLAAHEPDRLRRLDDTASWNKRMAGAPVRDVLAGEAS